ncbi:MAG: peptide chain release factor N(5)-glutamine methyltransferase [Ktedonobacteraceae bacterium]|nr:peptide chain release factor N(5)-glutamine methyltransferase [Ktedonobacteraceae bacterium]
MTTVREALTQGIQELRAREEYCDARLDAQILLEHVLGVERALFYAYPERPVTPEQRQQFLALIARRKQGEPVAYLVGHKEFYGLDLLVDRRVLIPRPETELLVEMALQIIRQKLAAGQIPLVADIGTGSGAIPIALAVEEPRLPYLYACDISSAALEVARLNCQKYHVEKRVRLLQGDLLAPLPEAVDVLIANLPYVGTEEMVSLAPEVRAYEPSEALFSGLKGLDLLRRFCQEARNSGRLKSGAVMLLEIGYQQCEPLTDLVHELWPAATVTCKKDYAGWDRMLQVAV